MAASILKKAGKYLQNLGESVLSKQLEKQEGVADKNDEFGLQRFVTAQNTWNSYDVAVKELAAGRKRSHWIWFVLPQMRGLGHSYKSNYYGISCGHEAEAYLAHEVLGERLRNVCAVLLEQADKHRSAREVLGSIDAQKTFSSLTLFDSVSPNDIFAQCLDRWFDGKRDKRTLLLYRLRLTMSNENEKKGGTVQRFAPCRQTIWTNPLIYNHYYNFIQSLSSY